MKRWIMVLGGTVAVAALFGLMVVWPAAAQRGAMWGPGGSAATSGTPITLAQARDRVTQYLSQVGLTTLTAGEVMQFSNQFYVEVRDSTSGNGAFEVLVSLDGQTVHPEPTMMWNTQYNPMFGTNGAALRQGMMGGGYGMMGGGYGMWGAGTPGTGGAGGCHAGAGMGYQPGSGSQLAQPLTAESALTQAQAWLDQNRAGLTATDPVAFRGYFTLHTERDGQIVGMLSIQTTTGAIWEHTWHGDLVAMDAGTQ